MGRRHLLARGGLELDGHRRVRGREAPGHAARLHEVQLGARERRPEGRWLGADGPERKGLPNLIWQERKGPASGGPAPATGSLLLAVFYIQYTVSRELIVIQA